MIEEESIRGREDSAFEAAMRAFHKGPPGVVRRVAQNDPTPPEYEPLKTTARDERQAIADVINAYLPLAEERLSAQVKELQTELDRVRSTLIEAGIEPVVDGWERGANDLAAEAAAEIKRRIPAFREYKPGEHVRVTRSAPDSLWADKSYEFIVRRDGTLERIEP